MPTLNASTMSTTGKSNRTNTTDPKNTSKATRGNDGGRVEDAFMKAGSGGRPGGAGRGGTARANAPPSPARKNYYDNKRLQRVEPPSY